MSKDSRDLLESVADRLPSDLVDSYRTYSDVGEWAMLVDVLCAILVKRRIPVTEAERDAVANVLGQFDLPVEGYRYLNDPQGVLSELNVVTA
ncbi:MafI family immunity protein [Nocardia implantans]|uniref:MafI family immunity protein n=1 Tax=Nocardia implantans TaxID=3108168 RepID=A0ABU6B4Q4_9NOCA|nr:MULTISPECIES: MafI family immunity protein [unclassified Nocardia]MBF6196184.1 MafI family immunity protein [Nocardia beijingensis]MEA3532824.1 MafI family immunity protein [Nocardia sp. CDC192]MEB3514696.1 MafI family immunity protein [Nocardia sp. CDC186]